MHWAIKIVEWFKANIVFFVFVCIIFPSFYYFFQIYQLRNINLIYCMREDDDITAKI